MNKKVAILLSLIFTVFTQHIGARPAQELADLFRKESKPLSELIDAKKDKDDDVKGAIRILFEEFLKNPNTNEQPYKRLVEITGYENSNRNEQSQLFKWSRDVYPPFITRGIETIYVNPTAENSVGFFNALASIEGFKERKTQYNQAHVTYWIEDALGSLIAHGSDGSQILKNIGTWLNNNAKILKLDLSNLFYRASLRFNAKYSSNAMPDAQTCLLKVFETVFTPPYDTPLALMHRLFDGSLTNHNTTPQIFHAALDFKPSLLTERFSYSRASYGKIVIAAPTAENSHSFIDLLFEKLSSSKEVLFPILDVIYQRKPELINEDPNRLSHHVFSVRYLFEDLVNTGIRVSQKSDQIKKDFDKQVSLAYQAAIKNGSSQSNPAFGILEKQCTPPITPEIAAAYIDLLKRRDELPGLIASEKRPDKLKDYQEELESINSFISNQTTQRLRDNQFTKKAERDRIAKKEQEATAKQEALKKQQESEEQERQRVEQAERDRIARQAQEKDRIAKEQASTAQEQARMSQKLQEQSQRTEQQLKAAKKASPEQQLKTLENMLQEFQMLRDRKAFTELDYQDLIKLKSHTIQTFINNGVEGLDPAMSDEAVLKTLTAQRDRLTLEVQAKAFGSAHQPTSKTFWQEHGTKVGIGGALAVTTAAALLYNRYQHNKKMTKAVNEIRELQKQLKVQPNSADNNYLKQKEAIIGSLGLQKHVAEIDKRLSQVPS